MLLLATVAGFYFYARYRVRRAIKEIPQKLGVDIQQTAQGFTFSKSQGGRTLFTIRAANTVQYKAGQRAELRDVNIIIYGKRGDRFDQIYGSSFAYDPQAKTVTARGEVHIDLQAAGAPGQHPDQATPQELKNPVHIKTSGLVFDQNTGVAETHETIDFRAAQGHGTARGARYDANAGTLTIESDIHVVTTGKRPADVTAKHGVVTKEPLLATFDAVHGESGDRNFDAPQLKVQFRDDSTVEHATASGGVTGHRGGNAPADFRAGQVEVAFDANNEARSAVVNGHAVIDGVSGTPVLQKTTMGTSATTKGVHGEAQRMQFDFAPGNTVRHVHADGAVRLAQFVVTTINGAPSAAAAGARGRPPLSAAPPFTDVNGVASDKSGKVLAGDKNPQDIEVTAPQLDVDVREGKLVQRASTEGASRLTIVDGAGKTVADAGHFDVTFDQDNHPKTLRGSQGTKIVTSAVNQPDRTTTGREMNVEFAPEGGIASLEQSGNFHYEEGTRKADAQRASYRAADQVFVLNGGARFSDGAVSTGTNPGAISVSAAELRLNRKTGDVAAQTDVKVTYSDLKQIPGGALLGANAPIHVTAAAMSAGKQAGTARFSGGARLWQDANIVEAPTIEFDRERKSMLASAPADSGQRVTTSFVQKVKNDKPTPVTVTSGELSYSDLDRQAHFTSGVVMRGAEATVNADRADVVLQARTTPTTQATPGMPSQLQQITALGHVRIEEPKRRATGEKLVYTAADGKYVLTGGPPSIFSAEKGTLTGDSLTFFSRDDTVLVEGGTGRAPTPPRVSH